MRKKDMMTERRAREIVWMVATVAVSNVADFGYGYETGAGGDADLIRQHDEMIRMVAEEIADELSERARKGK